MQIANVEFQKIITFFRQHKLSLHPLKTKFVIFSNSTVVRQMDLSLVINFNNHDEDDQLKISRVERILHNSEFPAVRFLGVYFDPLLYFNSHIKIITSKLSRALYMLRTSKNFLTIKARKVIYYSLFHCHLIYCLPIWSCSTTNNIKGIITMQKKAIRIVSGSSYITHIRDLFFKN